MIAISPGVEGVKTISNHGFADVVEISENGHKALVSLTTFAKGETICIFYADTVSEKPTYLTVQTDIDKHITLSPSFLQYINHSCNPNVFFDTTLMEIVALREISRGDELVFFYPSTEWEMDRSFSCLCGHTDCLQQINGARFVPKKILSSYRLTDFIHKMLEGK